MGVEICLPGTTTVLPTRPDGVAVSVLLDMPDTTTPVVVYPGCPSEHGLAMATTTQLSRTDIGAQVALMFVAGDLRQSLLIDRIRRLPQEALVQLDGERLEFSAEREIVLCYNKTNITLTRAGKVIIRGAYLSSRSTGANRIKGGSVRIN